MASRREAPSSPPRTWNMHDDQHTHSSPQQSTKSPKLRAREPPPTLFLHPSPAASHVSLNGFAPSTATPGNPGSTTAHAPTPGPSGLGGSKPNIATSLAPGMTSGRIPFRTADSSRSADRTDALWAEMQATLEEVEVSASGGTTIFGQEHDRKLGQLRAAQIALAQAWARSEADDAIETREGGSTVAGGAGPGAAGVSTGDEMRPLAKSVGDQTVPDVKSTTGGTSSIPRPGSSGRAAERLGARLEEETKADILLARRRREANDRYFQRVSSGVLDVVAKLEEVAKAMTEVEQESKSVWNDDDSMGGNPKV